MGFFYKRIIFLLPVIPREREALVFYIATRLTTSREITGSEDDRYYLKRRIAEKILRCSRSAEIGSRADGVK